MSGAYLELAAAAAGEAIRGLLKTVVGTTVLAVLLAGMAFWIAFGGSWQRGLLAVVLVLIEAGILGAILAAKRAVLDGLAGGIQHQHLARSAAMAMLSPKGPLGKVAGLVPLAEAERRLRQAVDLTVGGMAQGQGLRAALTRAIQRRLAELVEQITLARFRADAAERGGEVELAQVCAEIGDRADAIILGKVRGVANRLTAMVVLASSAIAVLVALALRQWNPA